MQPKFKLSEPTELEKQNFMNEFNELCNKHSMYFEPIPQYQRENITSPWDLKVVIFLQKKKEIVEVEKDSIKSPLSDEFTKDEPNQETEKPL
jgi:hypothetical protein